MRSHISRQTLGISGILFGLAAAVYATVLVLIGMKLERAYTAVSDFGEVAVVLLAAVVVLRTALSFGKGEAVRRYWLLIGGAVAMYCVGDAIWAYVEVVQGKDPFPGPSDFFYVGQYVLLFAGVLMAALAYRRMVDVRAPLLTALGVSIVFAGVLYQFLLKDVIADTSTPDFFNKGLSVFYPLADVFLALLPALFIAFVAWRLGRGSFGWPWWPVALGLVLLAVSDAGFAYLDWNELYHPGHIVDVGWMLTHGLIATGALVARDVFGVTAEAKVGREKAAA